MEDHGDGNDVLKIITIIRFQKYQQGYCLLV